MGMTQNTHHSRRLFKVAGAACALAMLTLAAGCGDDEATDSADTTAATTASTAAEAVGEITLTGQWARTSPAMASMGAAYVTITSPIDDKLVGASADASIAAAVEVHEMYMMEGDTGTTMAMGSDSTMAMGSDTTMDMGGGEMGMRPVEFVELPAGVAVELKPGGYHIMFIDLVKPLEVGTTISLTLIFETAGEIVIEVPVLDEAP
jgi:copper(I)-binding protein